MRGVTGSAKRLNGHEEVARTLQVHATANICHCALEFTACGTSLATDCCTPVSILCSHFFEYCNFATASHQFPSMCVQKYCEYMSCVTRAFRNQCERNSGATVRASIGCFGFSLVAFKDSLNILWSLQSSLFHFIASSLDAYPR